MCILHACECAFCYELLDANNMTGAHRLECGNTLAIDGLNVVSDLQKT